MMKCSEKTFSKVQTRSADALINICQSSSTSEHLETMFSPHALAEVTRKLVNIHLFIYLQELLYSGQSRGGLGDPWA